MLLEKLEKFSEYVLRVTEIITSFITAIILITIILAVGDRFLFHIGLFWSQELARYLYIWMAFLAGAVMVQRRGHFTVRYFVDRFFGEVSKQILDIMMTCLMILLMVVLLVYGVKFAEFGRFQYSAALVISMSCVYWALPVGVSLMLFFWLIQLLRRIAELREYIVQ